MINQIQNSVNTRISNISSSEAIFNEAKDVYEDALKKSGHTHNLIYSERANRTTDSKKKRKRRNNIMWFNPPYNKSLKTNIGREFLRILDKNFPPNSILRPLLNRSTVKLSYCCTENMGQIMTKHNRKILAENKDTSTSCNCRNKDTCPVDGKCQTECVVYKATVKDNEAVYVGITELPFKSRFRNHTHTFRTEAKKSSTALSNYIWDKGLAPNPEIKWEIIRECQKYKPGKIVCDLCLSEKKR